MSRSVRSDGTVNQLIAELCEQEFGGHSKEEVDKVLKDEAKLKQCKYETLLHAGATYFRVFKEKNWPIQYHIEIKARQSEEYRNWCETNKRVIHTKAIPTNGNGGKHDPLKELLK